MSSGTTCWKTNTSTASCTSWTRSGQLQPSAVRRWVARSCRAARWSTSSRAAAICATGPAGRCAPASRRVSGGASAPRRRGRAARGVDRTLARSRPRPTARRGAEDVSDLLPADRRVISPSAMLNVDRRLDVEVDDVRRPRLARDAVRRRRGPPGRRRSTRQSTGGRTRRTSARRTGDRSSAPRARHGRGCRPMVTARPTPSPRAASGGRTADRPRSAPGEGRHHDRMALGEQDVAVALSRRRPPRGAATVGAWWWHASGLGGQRRSAPRAPAGGPDLPVLATGGGERRVEPADGAYSSRSIPRLPVRQSTKVKRWAGRCLPGVVVEPPARVAACSASVRRVPDG